MKKTLLYKDEKFSTWIISRVVDVLCKELQSFNPELKKDIIIYGRKSTLISFKGDVNVALEITKQRFSEKDSIQIYVGLSLSPMPYELKTHVLNTLDMAVFMMLCPKLHGKRFFSIAKEEPWNGSILSLTVEAMRSFIGTMLVFESCFHLLLDDEYEIEGIKLDSKSLSLTHHLNQVKAYRLAEIYGHPEKLDEAIKAIKKFATMDELSKQRLEMLCAKKDAGGMSWLYTREMIERLYD